MKDRFKRMWIENKSKNKKPEEVIKNDTAKALEKMISILSKSDTPELIKTNQKLNLIKKKVWKEIRHQQQKEKEIQTIKEQIGQKTKTPCTLILKQQLKILKNPEPLEPLEMVDALLSLPKPPRYKISSIKKVSERIDELEKTSNFNTEDLIYAASELTSTVLTTPIKYKIDLRQKFLTETLGSLSIVTKLPNKPGDQENISGIVKNLQESFKGVFTHDQELYKKQVDLLAESLQLLLRIRGELKAWVDVDKFVKQYKITDGQLARMIKNAKEPNGSGIFSFLGGQDVNKLSNLLDITLTLTQDHRLFYKTIIKPHKKDNLILKLTKHKEALQQKINLVFQSSVQKQYFPYNNTNNIKLPIVSEHLTKLQLAIINSIFNQQNTLIDQISPLSLEITVTNIILKYLGIDNIIIRANKSYKDQLYHTNTAIKWLTGIQESYNKPVKKLKHDDFDYADLHSIITEHLKQEHIINIILEYIITENSEKAEFEYLCNLKRFHLKEKSLLLNQTQEILSFFKQFILKGNVQHFQKILQLLDLIELDSHSSNFLKIIDLRGKSNLEFIQKTIDPIIYLIRFFNFENMLILNTNNKLVLKEIEKIEEYLTNQTGPMLKTLIESAIDDESELLNNLSYLIKHESTKNLNAFKLLDLLIRLTGYGKLHTQNLLSVEGLKNLVDFTFTNQIVVKDDDKFSLLFYLIDSGYANINMVDKLLKKEIDINEWHNGRTLLDSITYQLTKVGRETDFSERPKKYAIDPEKQDQLINVALYLIHNKADINSLSHTRGFLTTLFSIIPSEQSPYLYKKLLSDQEIISQLDLQEVDLFQRNLTHLFCKDISEFFYSIPDAQVAKVEVNNILTSIISSKNSHYSNNQDRVGNTPWHYLASSITADYVNIKTDFSKIKITFNLGKQNQYGDTTLHAAFTMLGDPAAFYEFVLTDIYSPAQWLKSPRLELKIKNNEKQSVLDMIINTKNKLAASVINVYMAVVNYKIDLDNDCTFETIRSKVNTYLKGIPQVPADELERTIYLGERYGSTKYQSSSSSSSLSSSSSSSMSSSFSSSFPSHLTIGLDMETEYDWHPKTPLGDSSDFALHG